MCTGGETCQSCSPDCGPCNPGCSHDLCTLGGPLTPICNPCIMGICMQMSSCCSTTWSQACIDLVGNYCGLPCPVAP
jgi:hypothetical protein